MPPFLDTQIVGTTLVRDHHRLYDSAVQDGEPAEPDDEKSNVRHDSPVEMRRPSRIGPPAKQPSKGAILPDGHCSVPTSRAGVPRSTSLASEPPGVSGSSKRPTSGSGAVEAPSHMFVMEKNPAVRKDRAEMRAIRQAVMHHHIQKNAQTSNKRKRVDIMSDDPPRGFSPNLVHPNRIFRDGVAGLTPSSSRPSTGSALDEPNEEMQVALRSSAPGGPQTSAVVEEMVVLWDPCEPQTTYLKTPPDSIPFPHGELGGKINAFNSWPAFADSRINVGRLKHSCSRLFGSRRLSNDWVPTLMKSRHAFLSTICISAAYDDIMRKAYIGTQASALESYERARVREEIIGMLNASLANPAENVSQGTITAVLHLLNSEILTNDPEVLRVHSNGLTRMVHLRGGLEHPTLGSMIPALLTVTIYLIAVMHETVPHEMYRAFAAARNTAPPQTGKRFPENPLYAGRSYVWLCRRLNPDGNLIRMLDLLRRISWAFLSGDQTPGNSVDCISRRILAAKPAALDPHASSEERQYEVVRLTARLYAHALSTGVPLSQAAVMQKFVLSSIRQALGRTCLDTCWTNLAGVLFWVSLVASAAAHRSRAAPKHRRTSEVDAEADEARRFFAAIAVRCSIVLGFEHGSAVLGTLKRMLELQQRLGDASGARSERRSYIGEVSDGCVHEAQPGR